MNTLNNPEIVTTYYNNVEPVNLLNISEENLETHYNQEICVICQESLSTKINEISGLNTHNNIFILPECSHAFHTDCIMTWFRMGNKNCPCCGNKGINSKNDPTMASSNRRTRRSAFNTYVRKDRIKSLRNFSNTTNAPKQLIKDFKKLDELKKMSDDVDPKNDMKQSINNADESETMSYKGFLKLRDARRKKWFLLRDKIFLLETKISTYPVIPIIIPKRR